MVEPEVVAPVEPLVPVLLEVPVVEPLVDGEVVVELPLAPMPELVPELEDDGIDDEVLEDGERVVELPVAPMPEVEPDVDAPVEPVVDEPLLVPEVDGLDCVAVDEDEGLVEPLADPPAAPMPEAEPLAVPEAEGPELQAARAAEQAMARINLFIRSPFRTRRGGCRDEVSLDCRARSLGRSSMSRASK